MKTWIDLLGRNTDWVMVDENRVVRSIPDEELPTQRHVTVLWTCDTPEQAQSVMEAWLTEVIKSNLTPPSPNDPPPGSWAAVARMMAADDDSGFDWDAWKDEMKERDL